MSLGAEEGKDGLGDTHMSEEVYLEHVIDEGCSENSRVSKTVTVGGKDYQEDGCLLGFLGGLHGGHAGIVHEDINVAKDGPSLLDLGIDIGWRRCDIKL